MNASLTCRALALSVALVGALIAPARAQVITNGGFESGFAGWNRAEQPGSDGTFLVQSGTTSPINAIPVPPPPQGVNAAMSDAGGPGSRVLYQDFVVPTGGGTYTVNFSLFLNNLAASFVNPGHLDFATPAQNQQARVDIITLGADLFSVSPGDVLQNLFQTNPGDPLTSGYTPHVVDASSVLAARQGQTLRLRFAAVDNVNIFNFGVDDVSIQQVGADAVPEPSSLVLASAALVPCLKLARKRRRSESEGEEEPSEG